MPEPEFRVFESLRQISPAAWNALAPGQPLLGHAYFDALIESGCVHPDTGWTPRIVTAWDAGALVGAVPLFLKSHSWGEYVFDWAWAEAYRRHGRAYYPKLVAAVPFTPCPGPRLLARDPAVRPALAGRVRREASALGASSVHVLFADEADREVLASAGWSLREGLQFHWSNPGYPSFEHFLAQLSHDKRKKIRQERRKLREAGVSFRWLDGRSARERDWAFFHGCYERTYHEHGGSPYLSLEFFLRLADSMPEALFLAMGEDARGPACAALGIVGEGVLYGRYWGAVRPHSGLHFEACYYQGIEYCIARGLSRFEGGAQGAHKLARGFLPAPTWSAHWLADPEFARAVARFVEQERREIEHVSEELEQHSPFRHAPPAG